MTLHPELQRAVVKSKGFTFIHHPLVVTVYGDSPFEVDMYNRSLEVKKQAVEAALKDRDFARYVVLHERPYRYLAMMRVIKKVMPHYDRHEIIRDTFVDSENIHQNLKGWKNLLRPFIGRDVWGTLQDLPDTFTVYRGGTRTGISWTLDRERAEWFANRYHRPLNLWKAQASKAKAIAHFTERGEDEIVIFPSYLSNIESLVSADHHQG